MNSKYLKAMNERANRVVVDLKYVEMVGKWGSQREENFKFAF